MRLTIHKIFTFLSTTHLVAKTFIPLSSFCLCCCAPTDPNLFELRWGCLRNDYWSAVVMRRFYFCMKLCVERLSIPDHTIDHCDSLFCGAVNVCFFFLFCPPLWDFKAVAGCRIGGGNSLYVCTLQHFGSGEEEGVEKKREKKKRTVAFTQAVVCLPKKTQRNVSARRWSAKSSFLSATILLPTSWGTRRQNMSMDDFVGSWRRDLIR